MPRYSTLLLYLFLLPTSLLAQVEEGIYSGQNYDPPATPVMWYERPLIWVAIAIVLFALFLFVRRWKRKRI